VECSLRNICPAIKKERKKQEHMFINCYWVAKDVILSFITTTVVTDVNHWLDGFRTGEQIAATHGAKILLRDADGGFGIFLLNMHAYISSVSSFKNSIVIKN
jgi:hypothetical protein